MADSTITRRLLLAGLAAGAAGAASKKTGGQPHIFQVVIKGLVPLHSTDQYANDGKDGTFMGYAIGCPQDCARNHNNGNSATTPVFVSPEWIMDLVYGPNIKTVNQVNEAQQRYSYKIQNSPAAKGCGRISQLVYLTKVDKNAQNWYETRDAKQYYVLADKGAYDPASGAFNPTRICISQTAWDPTGHPYLQGVIQDIKQHLSAQPSCT